jgi:hypothetical protein
MQRRTGSCPPAGSDEDPPSPIKVALVNLLGVPVTARAALDRPEHERRRTLGINAITNASLLDRLLNLPLGVPVADRVIWAETAGQPEGVVERAGDGQTVTRLVAPPLTIDCVMVSAQRRGWLRAVQDASLFACFAKRWVVISGRDVPGRLAIEAKFFGIGLMTPGGHVLLEAEKPTGLLIDGWAWLLREKTYQGWLSELTPPGMRETQAGATGTANRKEEG